MSFEAIRIDKDDAGYRAGYVVMEDADLMPGDVDIDVTHSTINYKDGLAITGKGPIVRRFPMIPGVDFAGRVKRSTHRDFAPGDLVVAGGCGLRRGAFRRVRAKSAGERRLACPAAGGPVARRGHGHRHGGPDGHALRARAGALWHEAGQAGRWW